MKRRQWTVLGIGLGTLLILHLLFGIIVFVTMMVTGLTLSAIAGLIFDKREDDVTKDIYNG